MEEIQHQVERVKLGNQRLGGFEIRVRMWRCLWRISHDIGIMVGKGQPKLRTLKNKDNHRSLASKLNKRT
ncbi:hypothetical protein V6N11_042117 [Hibiscus sabdariffa]|uniref:Uncharacterized protein n=1 Tax=Hibiscus sabdariffa TaxID=183260 RepID=A0ABR2QW40_9ROSI